MYTRHRCRGPTPPLERARDQCPVPSPPRPRARRHSSPLPDVPARALRRDLLDQPVDAPRRPGRPGAGAGPVGRAASHLPRPGPPRRPARSRTGPAGHGLHRQRRHGRRRRGARRAVPARRAGGRGRGAPRVVPGCRLRGRGRAGVRQRGRGRPAGGGGDRAGRQRVPHRSARPRRGRHRAGPRHRRTGAGGPALLPPRHRRRRARRDHDRLAAPCVLPGLTGLALTLAARGFIPVPVDLSELLKGGGGPKCCTLELRA